MREIEHFLLDRARKGLLRLMVNGDVEIEYFHIGRNRWYTKKPDAHPKTGRARFRFGPKRDTVYRNRLVWMIHNLQPIPDDHVVDHADQNRLNDFPGNLELMKLEESKKQGNAIQQDCVLEQLCRWFDFLGEYGREPVTPREISWVEVGF